MPIALDYKGHVWYTSGHSAPKMGDVIVVDELDVCVWEHGRFDFAPYLNRGTRLTVWKQADCFTNEIDAWRHYAARRYEVSQKAVTEAVDAMSQVNKLLAEKMPFVVEQNGQKIEFDGEGGFKREVTSDGKRTDGRAKGV